MIDRPVCLLPLAAAARRSALLLFTLTLLSACSEPAATPEDLVRPVKTIEVKAAQSAEKLSQTGEIRPFEETSLGFRIDGRLLRRLVDVGATVQAGELIAELDPSDSENQLKSAKAQLDSALSSEKLALANLNRIKQLLPGGAVSQAQLDQAESSFDASVSARKSAEASLSGAKDRLSFTRLVADKAGVVSVVSANQGQVVAAGQEIIKLAALDGKDAVFDVSDSLIGVELADVPVEVTLLSDRSIKAIGKTRDVSPVADPLTRTYRVRVSLQNPPAGFSFGATVIGSIELPGSGQISIPASALTRQGDQPAVLVVDPTSLTLRQQPVSVARYSDNEVLLSGGLNGGEKVVVAGVSKLRPGQQVKLLTETR